MKISDIRASLKRLAERLVQQDHLGPHVGEQHVEDDEVEHRGHPHAYADVGAVVEQVEAEVHEEDLHRDHDDCRI